MSFTSLLGYRVHGAVGLGRVVRCAAVDAPVDGRGWVICAQLGVSMSDTFDSAGWVAGCPGSKVTSDLDVVVGELAMLKKRALMSDMPYAVKQ